MVSLQKVMVSSTNPATSPRNLEDILKAYPEAKTNLNYAPHLNFYEEAIDSPGGRTAMEGEAAEMPTGRSEEASSFPNRVSDVRGFRD